MWTDFPETNYISTTPLKIIARVKVQWDCWPWESFLKQSRTPVRQESLLEKVITKTKYDIAGVRSGTILLKPDWINSNDLSHPIRNRTNSSLNRRRQISEVTLMNPSTWYSDARECTLITAGWPQKVLDSPRSKIQYFPCTHNHPTGSVLLLTTVWHSRHPEYLPVALCTPLHKRNPRYFIFRQWLDQVRFIRKQQVMTTDFLCSAGWDLNMLSQTSHIPLGLLVLVSLSAPTTFSYQQTRDCAIAQAVSRRLPTAAARVRSQLRSSHVQCDTVASFLQVFRLPCQFSFHQLQNIH
jgi:hypothetical protein